MTVAFDPIPPADLVRDLWQPEDALRFLPEVQNVYAAASPEAQRALLAAVAAAVVAPTIGQATDALRPLGLSFVERNRLVMLLWDSIMRHARLWRERAERRAVRSASPGT